MSHNTNSTSPMLPTARKSRRTSQRNRPVLVKSSSQGTQEFERSQSETLEPENSNESVGIEPLAEASAATETPEVSARARRTPRLPSFFSKVEKTVEEPETSKEEVAKARLARAQKTTAKAEAKPAAKEKKESEGKPAREANRTTTTDRPNKLFKTRHFIGMAIYLFAAELLLPLEATFSKQLKIEQAYGKIPFLNVPITTSLFLNLATLIILLLVLVKLDLLPTSMGGRTAATTRAQQGHKQQDATEKQPQPTIRQGVKGEHDDLYRTYRSNQRREKKH